MSRHEVISAVALSAILFLGVLSLKFLLLILPLYFIHVKGQCGSFVLSRNEVILAVGVLVYVSIGLFSSVFLHNSLPMSADLLIALVLVLVVRRDASITARVVSVLAVVFNAVSSLLLTAVTIFYVVHHANAESLGFGNLTDVKMLYRPLLMLCNDNASLLLCMLPFLAFLSWWRSSSGEWRLQKWSMLNMSLCLLCLSFSYSRGAYLALSLFFVMILWLSGSGRSRIALLVCCSLVPIELLFISVPSYRNAVVTTAQFFGTESQRRSFDSRIEKLRGVSGKSSCDLWGCGEGNYFVWDVDGRTSYDTVVSASSCNGLLQLWRERGLLGIFALLLSMCVVAYRGFCNIGHGAAPKRKLKTEGQTLVFMLAGLSALFVRELSYASITRVTPVLFLALVMCYLLCVGYERE